MVNEFSSLIYYDNEGRIDYYDYIGAYTNSSGVNDWSTTYSIDFLNDGRLNSFRLDANSDITSETASATVNFSYDRYKRVTNKYYTYSASSQSFTGSVAYTYTEISASTSSQIATYTSTFGSSSVTSTYTYDANGNVTKIVYSTDEEYRYVYDDLGQLLREDNTVTDKTYVYEYDNAGNITSKTTYALTAAEDTPTSPISSITYVYTDSLGWGDLLTSYGGGSITYDAIGNPLSYDNGELFTFTWKNGRQLATASGNGYTLSFNYNDEGIRTSKTVNNVDHTYHLSGTDIIAEEWGNNLIIYLYDSNGSPMGMQYRTSSMDADEFYTFWFEKNLQGDIVAVYNSAGIKLVSYKYDAWGNCSTEYHNLTGTNSYVVYNPFRYRGYYYDTELGFYYLNSRYYDPASGRFLNPDSASYIGADGTLIGYNLFAYCGNNPVNHCDPSGHWIETVFDLFSLGMSIIDVVINPLDPFAWAGLAGDAFDLIPLVTGIGETIKGMRVVAKGADVAQDTLVTIRFVQAADRAEDFVDNGLDLAKALEKTSNGFTISNRIDGIKIHKSFMDNGKVIPGSRLRVDGLKDMTIYELKPYNRANLRKGVKQILNYNVELGGSHSMIIVFY